MNLRVQESAVRQPPPVIRCTPYFFWLSCRKTCARYTRSHSSGPWKSVSYIRDASTLDPIYCHILGFPQRAGRQVGGRHDIEDIQLQAVLATHLTTAMVTLKPLGRPSGLHHQMNFFEHFCLGRPLSMSSPRQV